MLRTIGGVIFGYAVMAAWVVITLALAWMVLGSTFAFREGTTEVTLGWTSINLVLGFIGAVLGGMVAAVVGRQPSNTAVKGLAAIVLILGLATAVAQVVGERPTALPTTAPEEMNSFEAASEAVAPIWYQFVIPVVGFLGVLLGGKWKRPAAPSPPGSQDDR